MKYGKLTIQEIIYKPNKKGKNIKFASALCDCGNTKEVNFSNLKLGKIKSCGCIKVEMLKEKLTTHGLTTHPLFKRWKNILTRCYNPKGSQFKDYGGRGIIMCNEWKTNFKSFYDWCINNGYSQELQIDRINNNGNYEPENCRFVTRTENIRNSSHTKLDANQVFHIRILCKTFSQKVVREMYNISDSQISKIVLNQVWN